MSNAYSTDVINMKVNVKIFVTQSHSKFDNG